MKKGIAINMLAILIITLIAVSTIVIAYSIYSNKGFLGFGNLFTSARGTTDVAENAARRNLIVCQQLLENKDCKEFYKRGCDKIIKERCIEQ